MTFTFCCFTGERTEVLVVDCSSMPEIDYTIVQACTVFFLFVFVFAPLFNEMVIFSLTKI